MSVRAWTFLIVGLTFGLYLFIAWLTRVRDTRGFFVAGRGVPAIANGMATGADWMSAASFISMAGLISVMGFAGGVYLMGWTGGYVLLALLLAPYLRKFGKFTVPDFIGDRYSGEMRGLGEREDILSRMLRNPARLVAVLCAVFVSFVYVAGQMRGVGVVFSRFLEVDINIGVAIGMAIVFIYATLGGMKGITWTQVAQYWVLITAYLIPAIAISIRLTGNPIPSLGMGSQLVGEGIHLLDKLNQINLDLGFASYTKAFASPAWGPLNVLCTTLALMAGTAGLPHVIVRFYTVKTVRAARWSAFWALFFIALLYLTAPATASFARFYMINSLHGRTVDKLPAWFNNWQKTDLILWFDDGDGRLRYSADENNEVFRPGHLTTAQIRQLTAEHAQWLAGAGGADARIRMRQERLSGPDNDIIVLATPEMAGLADWIIALVAAGGLAAALSTASGLLLVISSSIAHDLYYRVVNPRATEARRLLVGRTVIGLSVVVAGILGIFPPGFVAEVVAFAFGLAASSFFPAIVLGIFVKRLGTVPAVVGMLVGIVFTAWYIVGMRYFGMSPWFFGISAQGIGTIGMLLNFAVTLLLMPLCKPSTESTQQLIDRIREPEGAGPAVEIETAAEH